MPTVGTWYKVDTGRVCSWMADGMNWKSWQLLLSFSLSEHALSWFSGRKVGAKLSMGRGVGDGGESGVNVRSLPLWLSTLSLDSPTKPRAH